MLAYLFVVLAVLLRLVAGTGAFATLGFSLVGASLLFFGSRMPRKTSGFRRGSSLAPIFT